MKVLLTGADGYIGVIMGPKLIEAGHDVTGLDTGYYRRGWLFDDRKTHPKVVSKDLRDVTVEDLAGFDAVVHLSELSNDPIGENDPGLTMEINHKGSLGLAEKARAAGVKRFIYASSCSTYGAGGDEMRTETSDLAPQTAYAQCKILVERDVKALTDETFTPVFMRNATAYGASPRQRFDIVLNNLAGFAHTMKEIRMTSDGSPWRPIVHIEDICQAMLCALAAPREAVAGESFNVGADSGNYRIREIAEIVARTFPGCELTIGEQGGDTRSYRVSFAKIRAHMPDFETKWDAERGAAQLKAVFERIGLTREIFESQPFTRLKEIKHLRATDQIDDHLRWRALAEV
ncbi:MAG TPA: SDR family oxidoreductase [Amaricoccus sp.]|jgi:nucleoside-diphosphate-sugar epimerase|uniref:NAD-dependent epimerase/dehydratase family protein n=1 Tax=Amaricoccus sp. TaxID=1872485 RepID=UPI002C8850A4|nr:SDR family oxidoreductase [Amaricoccus sp.]HMR51704.1 SDR family oxidoreductase [Amaricoccus sp.]HMT98588.1 SDR family oxidoreductase [Amaricoccus sp.]